MGYFISRDGSYHEGDVQQGDIPVPQRPTALSTWDGLVWQPETAAAATIRKNNEAIDALSKDKFVLTWFEMLYLHEAQIRVLQGQPSITRAQFGVTISNYYKSLP